MPTAHHLPTQPSCCFRFRCCCYNNSNNTSTVFIQYLSQALLYSGAEERALLGAGRQELLHFLQGWRGKARSLAGAPEQRSPAPQPRCRGAPTHAPPPQRSSRLSHRLPGQRVSPLEATPRSLHFRELGGSPEQHCFFALPKHRPCPVPPRLLSIDRRLT